MDPGSSYGMHIGFRGAAKSGRQSLDIAMSSMPA